MGRYIAQRLLLMLPTLIGILLVGFAVTDGFDMGVGMLTRLLGRTDTERRVMINTIAPHWDGNQVWLITAGGALFAAWPMVYAAAFSGFYVAMILVLASLFVGALAEGALGWGVERAYSLGGFRDKIWEAGLVGFLESRTAAPRIAPLSEQPAS